MSWLQGLATNSGSMPHKKMTNAGHKTVWFGAAVLLIFAVSAFPQQPPSATEYQVKAAFLYNFAKFVEWPGDSFPSSSAPIQVCILGRDDFGQELQLITQDKVINGRRIEIDHVLTLNRARDCQVLFIGSSERSRTREILASVQGRTVLTISDEPGFAAAGGVINFILENSRVRFEINLTAAYQAHLKISSKLLALAKLVHSDRPGGN